MLGLGKLIVKVLQEEDLDLWEHGVLRLQQVTAKTLEELEMCRIHLDYWASNADQLVML